MTVPEIPESALRKDYPTRLFPDDVTWRAWLEENHASAPGVWLRLAKKSAPFRTVTFDQALETALCFGWIDGQGNRLDEHSYLQKFTPRGKRSTWSKRNREIVERLIAEGRMRPAGQAAIDAARADGRWDRAYDSPANATVPEDLRAALAAEPAAAEHFETLSRSRRFLILHQIQTAVRPETRARRIERFVAMLASGKGPA